MEVEKDEDDLKVGLTSGTMNLMLAILTLLMRPLIDLRKASHLIR